MYENPEEALPPLLPTPIVPSCYKVLAALFMNEFTNKYLIMFVL